MDIETNRQFYVVFSSRSMDSIHSLITEHEDYLNEDQEKERSIEKCSLLVPDKFHNQQTMRSICVIDPLVFDELKNSEDNIPDFKIEKLQMKKHFYPNEKFGELPNLYLILPTFLDLTAVQHHLIERMSSLMRLGIWNKNDYSIHLPNIDRVGNRHNGSAHILFKDNTRRDDIMLTKLFINNTKWPGTNHEVRCYWSKTKEAREAEHKNRATRNETATQRPTSATSNGTSGKSTSDKVNSDKGTSDKGNFDNVWVEKSGKHK